MARKKSAAKRQAVPAPASAPPAPPAAAEPSAIAVRSNVVPLPIAASDDTKRRERPEVGVKFSQPSSRSYVLWTPSLLRSIEYFTGCGSLSRIADVCDWIWTDDRARTVLETRVGALLGAPLDFEDGATRSRTAKRVRRALEVQEDYWTMFREAEMMRLMALALLCGICPAQEVWTDSNRRVVPVLETWDPRNLRIDDKNDWWITVATGGTSVGTQEVLVNRADRRWFLYQPFGKIQPWRLGYWRNLKNWRLLKEYALLDWGCTNENASRLFIEQNAQAIKEARQELAQEIMDAGKDAVGVLPPGCTAHLIEQTANTTAIFQAQISAADTGYAICVLGQNLTTEVKGGSFAAASVSAGVEAKRIRFDAEVASTELHDGPLTDWAEVNFGTADVTPWPKWNVEPPKDTLRWAQTLNAALPALFEAEDRGLPVDWEAVFKELGIPAKEGVEFVEVLRKQLNPTPPSPPKSAGDAALKPPAPTPVAGEGDKNAIGEGETEAEGEQPEE